MQNTKGWVEMLTVWLTDGNNEIESKSTPTQINNNNNSNNPNDQQLNNIKLAVLDRLRMC